MTIEFVNNSTVELVDFMGGDEDVARAAWVSNLGEAAQTVENPERIPGLIKYLHSNAHMSPFEHNQFKFFVETPIFVAREFMRHRSASYNEVSGRYKKMGAKFYIPPADRPLIQMGKPGAYTFVDGKPGDYELVVDELQKANEEDWKRYEKLLNAGIAREVARQTLPLNLMTSFYVSMNARNLMGFLTLRQEGQALYEIREVADLMAEIFAERMPLTNAAYRDSIEAWIKFKEFTDDTQS